METRISDIYFRAYTLDGQVQLEAEYNAYEYSLELVDTIMDSYEAVVRELMNKEKVVDIDISTEDDLMRYSKWSGNTAYLGEAIAKRKGAANINASLQGKLASEAGWYLPLKKR